MTRTALQIGKWLVEPTLKRLSCGPTSIEVEPKTMAVLLCLASRPGEVFSTDEIIEQVWGNRPMGDNPVYKCIAKLRRALDDEPGAPSCIATVTKVGYRLLLPVSAADTTASEAVRPEPASAAKDGAGSRRNRWVPLTVVGGVLLGLLIAASVSWQPQRAAHGQQRLLSTVPGSHGAAAISPDGQQLAFVNDVGGHAQIWLMSLFESEPRALTSADEPSHRPRWLPDGRSLLFSRGGAIWTIDTGSGEERRILQGGRNASVSADGTRLAFERRDELWISDFSGENQRRVTGAPEVDLLIAARDPALSPDGHTIAFFQSAAGPMGDIWTVPAEGGPATRLTDDETFAGSPAWTADGRYIVFSSQRGGSRNIWRVPAAGGDPEPLLTGAGDNAQPAVSADGRNLVFTNTRVAYRLTRSYPQRAESTVLLESALPVFAPTVSPNGATVAYFAVDPDNTVNIYTLPLTGGAPTRITREPGTVNAVPQWSGDGQYLYFYRSAPAMSFRKVAAGGGASIEVVAGWDWNRENGARVDPTGRYIAYSRLDRGVPVATMLRDVASAEEQVFDAVLEWPRWSANGEYLIGADFGDNHTPYRGDIAICTVAEALCRTLAREAHVPVFSADESRVLYVRPTAAGQDLYAVAVDGAGGERKIASLEPLQPSGSFFDVAADGSVLWVAHEVSRGQLWLSDLQPD